jgi:hypothetical protein
MLTAIAIIWVLIWVLVVVDLFRRPDWGLVAKLLWALGMLIFPVVGVIAYLIVRPATPSDVNAAIGSAQSPEERSRDRHPV